jgi:O-acetyl-ADP-ribose deacetylase (regulator of RNase III)
VFHLTPSPASPATKDGTGTVFHLTPSCELVIAEGDLTKADVDAIVNAANQRMVGGGGVDGAIHRAAGPELRDACAALPEVKPDVRCPTGEARITPGFRLPARWVIHTVGLVYRRPETSAPLLRAAYRSSLELANAHGLASVAFPAISCGVYGYPADEAAAISIETCAAYAGALAEVRFVLFGDAMFHAYRDAASAYLRK